MNPVFSEPFGKFVQPVQPKEKIAPRYPFRVGRQCQIAFVNSLRVKLVEITLFLSGALAGSD